MTFLNSSDSLQFSVPSGCDQSCVIRRDLRSVIHIISYPSTTNKLPTHPPAHNLNTHRRRRRRRCCCCCYWHSHHQQLAFASSSRRVTLILCRADHHQKNPLQNHQPIRDHLARLIRPSASRIASHCVSSKSKKNQDETKRVPNQRFLHSKRTLCLSTDCRRAAFLFFIVVPFVPNPNKQKPQRS